MATQRFAPELLARRTAAERAVAYEDLRKDFGTIKVGRITRRGPDAPVEMQITGSTGADGAITLDLTDEDPPRVRQFSVDVGKAAGGRGGEPAADALPPAPIAPTMSRSQMRAALTTYLAGLVTADRFAGVVLIARDGRPLFQQAFGLADRAAERANTTATRFFNIGSINKSFTQVAIAQLVAAGQLALTDPLGKFFPDYPQAVTRAATMEQLLNHRGGMADFFGPEFSAAAKDRFRSNADYFRLVSTLAPLFAPGDTLVLQRLLHRARCDCREDIRDLVERYVADRILAPAGMAHAGFVQTDAIEADFANGYTRRVDGASNGLRSNVMLHGASGSAAGGSYATAADLLAFANAHRNGRLPGDSGMMQVAGGAPGMNASLKTKGRWTVIVLSNLDPPSGEQVSAAIVAALAGTASGPAHDRPLMKVIVVEDDPVVADTVSLYLEHAGDA